jgi:hypothetical protein
MPVTAKLSRQFYERLGDDIATELVEWFNAVDATYRADLRDFNELNFARFDAKLGERVGQVRSGIAELRTEMEARFAASDAKLEQRVGEIKAEMSARFAAADAKLERCIGDLRAEMDARFAIVDAKLDHQADRLRGEMGAGFAQLRGEIATMRADLIKWMFVFVATATLAILGLG